LILLKISMFGSPLRFFVTSLVKSQNYLEDRNVNKNSIFGLWFV